MECPLCISAPASLTNISKDSASWPLSACLSWVFYPCLRYGSEHNTLSPLFTPTCSQHARWERLGSRGRASSAWRSYTTTATLSLPGKIALPNMIKGQFDQLSTLIMTELQQNLINSFQQLLQYSERTNWEILFIALAVLGNLVSRIGRDNARRAKDVNAEVGFRACIKPHVFSANTSSRVFAHFHKY